METSLIGIMSSESMERKKAELICYSRLLADMAKVEDLTRLSEEDKE